MFSIRQQSLFAFLDQLLGHWKVMAHQKPQQIFPSNAITGSRPTRGAQLAGANLSRRRHMAHGTIRGNLSGGERRFARVTSPPMMTDNTPTTASKTLKNIHYSLILYYFHKV
jgi:hypothetical protein